MHCLVVVLYYNCHHSSVLIVELMNGGELGANIAAHLHSTNSFHLHFLFWTLY